ncbi:MAG: YeeE/YedE family protein [Bacteroidota bacterium]
MKNTLASFFVLLSLSFAIYGIAASQWYLTAIPIGFLFGFFLQKGDLCASSAMSEAIMFKDRSKLWGFWVAIVTTMLSIAIIDQLGWISVNPKPFMWLSSIIGGLIFGVGMVFAGGCISGVLYKGGTGNVNSVMALMAVPFGIAAVAYGPLNNMHVWMQSFVVKGSGGEPLTLFSVTGIPYLILALIIMDGTIIYSAIKHKKKKFKFALPLNKSWKPWIAGIAIGILGIFAYLTSVQSGRNYPLGVTKGVLNYTLVLVEKPEYLQHIKQKPEKVKPVIAEPEEYKETNIKKIKDSNQPKKKVNDWLLLLVLAMIAGSWVSGALSGQSKLLPKDPEQTLFALFGGFMIGTGAAFAGGCSIGNILSGWGMMSLGNFIFGIVVLLANWAATYFYLMGGKLGK